MKKAAIQLAATLRWSTILGGMSARSPRCHCQATNAMVVTPDPTNKPIILELDHGSPDSLSWRARKNMTAAPRNNRLPMRSSPKTFLRKVASFEARFGGLKNSSMAIKVAAPTGKLK